MPSNKSFCSPDTFYSYTILTLLAIYCILSLATRANYYNNPYDEFDCRISDVKTEELDGDWRITFTITDIATNDTYDSREACWDSQNCQEIIDEYYNEEETTCVFRKTSGLFNRQKAHVTQESINYYTGDIWYNVLCWIYIAIYALLLLATGFVLLS